MKLYLMGSLRNPQVPLLGNAIRDIGYDVFDDWFGGGPEADDYWQKYEQTRRRTYREALYDRYAEHILSFDRHHLNTSDVGLLMHPVGRSAHIELGYMVGLGKRTYVYFDQEPERWDVMYGFADKVFFSIGKLLAELREIYHESE